MLMKQNLLTAFLDTIPSQDVFAHCDIPCGIYDPKPAQIAAATVMRMVELLEAVPQNNPSSEDRNKFIRCVLVKEQHAQKCKEELFILWADYFKPQHVTQFPALHDTFWKTIKLCSENKQHISREAAQKLLDGVSEIAKMFEKSKTSK